MSIEEGSFIAIIFSFLIVILIFGLIIIVLDIIAKWKILKKAGKPGWGAIIPVYNTYLLCDISGVSPWWILITIGGSFVLSVIPAIGSLLSLAVSIYFAILLNVSLARSFNKDDAFAVGLILAPMIFYLILAFDKSEYIGKRPMNDIIFKTNDNNTNNNEISKYCTACGNKIDKNFKFCSKCGKKV